MRNPLDNDCQRVFSFLGVSSMPTLSSRSNNSLDWLIIDRPVCYWITDFFCRSLPTCLNDTPRLNHLGDFRKNDLA